MKEQTYINRMFSEGHELEQYASQFGINVHLFFEVNEAPKRSGKMVGCDLYEIPYWVRSKKMNIRGFFWTADGIFSESWERIVP